MRRRRRHAEEHVSHERWLVSYADFVTLLFAFFVVLFAVTYKDNQAIRKLSKAIQKGFQTMGAFSSDESGSGGVYPTESTNPDPKEVKATAAAANSVDVFALRSELEKIMGNELRTHQVTMQITPEGFIISLKELGFFDSGKAELRPGAQEKLARIAKVLSKPGLELRIEGHSDNEPIHNDEFKSNWELSTARAMTVLLMLVNERGFDPRHISASGYGEYRPTADNSTAEGRRANRRVDLVVLQRRP